MTLDADWNRRQNEKLVAIQVRPIVAEIVAYSLHRRPAVLLAQAEAALGKSALWSVCKMIVEWWDGMNPRGWQMPLRLLTPVARFIELVPEFRELVRVNGSCYFATSIETTEMQSIAQYSSIATLRPPLERFRAVLREFERGNLLDHETITATWELFEECGGTETKAIVCEIPPVLLHLLKDRLRSYPSDAPSWQDYMMSELFTISSNGTREHTAADKRTTRSVVEGLRAILH